MPELRELGSRADVCRLFHNTEILEKDENGASDGSPNPLTADDVVGEDLVGNGSDEDDAIGSRQAHQVTVGR